MCDIHKLINYLISKALLTNSNTEFPREEFFTWRSRHKQDTGKKKVLQEQFYKTMPRAESFTAKKAQGKIFTEEYHEKTLSHSSRTEKSFHKSVCQKNVLHNYLYIIISRFKWLREERVLQDNLEKEHIFMTMSGRMRFAWRSPGERILMTISRRTFHMMISRTNACRFILNSNIDF